MRHQIGRLVLKVRKRRRQSQIQISQGADVTATETSGGTTDKQQTIKLMLSEGTDLSRAEFVELQECDPTLEMVRQLTDDAKDKQRSFIAARDCGTESGSPGSEIKR